MKASPNSAAWLAVVLLSGCAALPPERGYQDSRELLHSRWGEVADALPAPTQQQESPSSVSGPLSLDQAIALALSRNPRVIELYARIGVSRADLDEARRPPNPSFGYSRLNSSEGGRQITRSVSIGLSDWFLLPARQRIADGELQRVQAEVAAELSALAGEVESAWYALVGAQQVVAMRDLIAEAATTSAEFAERLHAAGNLGRLELERERAAASQARIDAVRAQAEAAEARADLAALLALSTADAWQVEAQLPAPGPGEFAAESLLPKALESRLDLRAAEQAVSLHESALATTRRWRWLGEVEFEYERESESDGARMRGPGLSLQLPVFSQGQPAIARAEAELRAARAARDALSQLIENDLRLTLNRVRTQADIIERYRSALLPQREAVVARSLEEVNFMLLGVFELIAARQDEYDAYQEYLEAVRDYWVARAELRQAMGGPWQGEPAASQTTLGVEAMLPSAAPAMDHSQHHGHGQHGGAPKRSESAHSQHHHGEHEAAPSPAPTEHAAPPASEQDAAEEHEHHHHGDTP